MLASYRACFADAVTPALGAHENVVEVNTVRTLFEDAEHYLHTYAEHGLASEPVNRVPMLVHWPGVTDDGRARSYQHLLYNIDYAPTVLSWLGLEIPDEMQGRPMRATGGSADEVESLASAAGVGVGVAQARDIEFVADNPGDWHFHCHLPHHMMNQMASMVGSTL